HTILIDNEQLFVSAVAANALTVVRGVNGTTAATHLDEATVSIFRYPAAIVDAAYACAHEAWGRRQLVIQQTTRKGDSMPLRDVVPEARALLAQYRRIAFAGV